MTGQANMWGEIKGTGLAGGGTGSAGKHGASGETVALHPQDVARRQGEEKSEREAGEFPPAFYQKDPASADLVIAHKEMNTPIEITHKVNFNSLEGDGFMPVRGLNVMTKTKEKTDKVLVIANLPTSMEEQHDGACWTLKRGNFCIGPQATSWTHEMGRLDNVLMPWLDEPDRARLELSYTASCRLKGSIKVSKEQERRQLTAIVVPGGQVTSSRSHEPLAVQPGSWQDVPGLNQISNVNKGEKVLVVCTMRYTALWSDEETRGRFTICRDGKGLDAESYGLQSVRSLQKGLKRTLVMALVDDPAPGPHVYVAKATVTTGDEEPRVCSLDEGDRQLALIRLPGDSVVGPCRCVFSSLVDEDRWTEIAGLAVTATVQGPGDKVLIVYNVNFCPSDMNYETYFTLFRTSASGSPKNLGQEAQGMWSVASSSAGSSEYPVSMFTDSPGAGTYTYTVYARTRRCDHLTEALPVEVGPDGQIAAVLLPAAAKRSGQPAAADSLNLVEQMAAEMDAAASEEIPH